MKFEDKKSAHENIQFLRNNMQQWPQSADLKSTDIKSGDKKSAHENIHLLKNMI